MALALVFAAAWYAYEVKVARPAASWMGVPQVTREGMENWTRIFRNKAYMVGYSEYRANPLWVCYKVTAKPKHYKGGKRPARFSADWRSIRHIDHDDYRATGFNRGHMAPNYIIASRYGRAAQKETFLMTNISPQTPRLNQKLWQRLEEVVADYFSAKWKTLWVYTGPIFSQNSRELKNTGIDIPVAFYKIIVRPHKYLDKTRILAFIMPQKVKGNESLMDFVVSVDEVEYRTGIDFFWRLPDDIEEHLEKIKKPRYWGLAKVAKKASRY